MITTASFFGRVPCSHLRNFSPISSLAKVHFQRAEAANKITPSETDIESLPFDDIPGPQGKYTPALGFYRVSEGFTKIYKLTDKLFKQYGPIFKQHVTDRSPVVHVMDPVDFQTVYRAEGKYPYRPPIDAIMEIRRRKGMFLGLENLNGKEWQRIRQAVAPKLMRPKVLEENIDNFNAVTNDTLKRLANLKETSGLGGEIPDLEGELSKWATESVGTLVFDVRVGLYNDPPSEEAMRFIGAIHDVFQSLHAFVFGILEKHLYHYVNTPNFVKLERAVDTSFEIGQGYIDKKMKDLKEMAHKGSDDSEELKAVSLLTYLLTREDLSLEEIYANAFTMFAAGVDTTSYTTLWTLYHLARNPEIQEILYQEISSILGEHGDATAGSLAKLSYLKACAKESARLTPVFPSNRRVLEKDVVLSGYLVPAQTIIQLEFLATAASEKYFKNASDYKPERWLRENKKDIDSFAFLPFGFGPRMCIGSRVAELETYLLVAKVIQRFRLEYHHEPLEMYQKLSAVPEKPVRIKFVDRH